MREAIANSEENKASLTVAIMAGTYYETGIAFDERDSSKAHPLPTLPTVMVRLSSAAAKF